MSQGGRSDGYAAFIGGLILFPRAYSFPTLDVRIGKTVVDDSRASSAIGDDGLGAER
jgi:hypothetical protein